MVKNKTSSPKRLRGPGRTGFHSRFPPSRVTVSCHPFAPPALRRRPSPARWHFALENVVKNGGWSNQVVVKKTAVENREGLDQEANGLGYAEPKNESILFITKSKLIDFEGVGPGGGALAVDVSDEAGSEQKQNLSG